MPTTKTFGRPLQVKRNGRSVVAVLFSMYSRQSCLDDSSSVSIKFILIPRNYPDFLFSFINYETYLEPLIIDAQCAHGVFPLLKLHIKFTIGFGPIVSKSENNVSRRDA